EHAAPPTVRRPDRFAPGPFGVRTIRRPDHSAPGPFRAPTVPRRARAPQRTVGAWRAGRCRVRVARPRHRATAPPRPGAPCAPEPPLPSSSRRNRRPLEQLCDLRERGPRLVAGVPLPHLAIPVILGHRLRLFGEEPRLQLLRPRSPPPELLERLVQDGHDPDRST